MLQLLQNGGSCVAMGGQSERTWYVAESEAAARGFDMESMQTVQVILGVLFHGSQEWPCHASQLFMSPASGLLAD